MLAPEGLKLGRIAGDRRIGERLADLLRPL